MHTSTQAQKHIYIDLHLLQIIQCWPELTPVFNSNKYVPFFSKFHSVSIVFVLHTYFSCLLLSLPRWGIFALLSHCRSAFRFPLLFLRVRLPIEQIKSIPFRRKKNRLPSPLIYFIYSDWHIFRVWVVVCACVRVSAYVLSNHNNSSIVIQFSFKLPNENAEKKLILAYKNSLNHNNLFSSERVVMGKCHY